MGERLCYPWLRPNFQVFCPIKKGNRWLATYQSQSIDYIHFYIHYINLHSLLSTCVCFPTKPSKTRIWSNAIFPDFPTLTELDDGKIYRKPWYLIVSLSWFPVEIFPWSNPLIHNFPVIFQIFPQFFPRFCHIPGQSVRTLRCKLQLLSVAPWCNWTHLATSAMSQCAEETVRDSFFWTI